MRIVRFATKGHEHLGNEHGDGRVTLLEGDLFGDLVDTGEAVRVEKRLSPLEPRDILCVGLNQVLEIARNSTSTYTRTIRTFCALHYAAHLAHKLL